VIRKFQDKFLFVSAILLFMAGAAKLLSAMGKASALAVPDPLLSISNRNLFLAMGSLELALSAFLLVSQADQWRVMLIAWLATNFIAYRAGLWWMGEPNLCNCLGDLSGYVALPPRILNDAALVMLAWLTLGSYGFLLLGLFGRRKAAKTKLPSDLRSAAAGA